jgi:hypothetical protein
MNNQKEDPSAIIEENALFKDKIIVGVSGYARSGKNTLCDILNNFCKSKGLESKIFSFAFALRQDLNSFCTEKFGISAFTENSEEKNKIRPLLISYGEVQRNLSNGLYWLTKLKPEINNFFKNGGNVALISDLRFKVFDFDEIDFVRSYPNSLIYCVSRIKENGEEVKPAHLSESENFPKICKKSDVNSTWRTVQMNSQELVFNAMPFLNSLNKKTSSVFAN